MAARTDVLDLLTERQRMIASCVKCGMTNDQIGVMLGIRGRVVANHLRNVYRKLEIDGPCHIRRTRLAVMLALATMAKSKMDRR